MATVTRTWTRSRRSGRGCMSRLSRSATWLAAAWRNQAAAFLLFLVSAGHVIFLPLLFLPLGLFGFGARTDDARRSRLRPSPSLVRSRLPRGHDVGAHRHLRVGSCSGS